MSNNQRPDDWHQNGRTNILLMFMICIVIFAIVAILLIGFGIIPVA